MCCLAHCRPRINAATVGVFATLVFVTAACDRSGRESASGDSPASQQTAPSPTSQPSTTHTGFIRRYDWNQFLGAAHFFARQDRKFRSELPTCRSLTLTGNVDDARVCGKGAWQIDHNGGGVLFETVDQYVGYASDHEFVYDDGCKNALKHMQDSLSIFVEIIRKRESIAVSHADDASYRQRIAAAKRQAKKFSHIQQRALTECAPT